jgi:hypothetical protein
MFIEKKGGMKKDAWKVNLLFSGLNLELASAVNFTDSTDRSHCEDLRVALASSQGLG